ncbi:MAG: hypothetical protein WA634_10205 [Silvibacterium sp.]
MFALEHGLAAEEFQEIRGLLLARLSLGLDLEPHWLLWVVYATEMGYAYDGEEYWDSFEQRTPRWRDRGSRNELRAWFSRFRTAYHGVKPSGPWADWFSIIAWPITHAILPKYLQWQFARTLYDLRYRLASLDALSPGATGQLLATNAWDSSTRFQEFLQQQELAGRIALALVGDREIEGQSPIYPQTLQRLVSDLEEVQSAREWLKETRRFVSDRLLGTARASGTTTAEPEFQHTVGGDDSRASLRIRPTLMLRRAEASNWTAVIEVLSFAAVARLYPELRAFLAGTRCRIAGTGDTWLPSGWLLSSARRRVLKSWPGAGVPLVRFERPNEALDQLVDSETSLPAGPVWLCRVGNDGLAREIAGRIVRPGRKYILLSEAELSADHPFLSSCGLDCAGIHAAALSMPDTFSSEHIAGLQQLGLQVARTVRVWPAGLPGRGWDGEGHSEWLTTEAPCFGIVHDHPVDSYGVRLDDGAEISIAAPAAGAAVFVRISPLPAGTHILSIKARRSSQTSAAPSSPAAEGVITLEVRAPEPWIPGTTSHPGLAISVDPPDPSLDMFWEGDVGVSVLGPAGRHITCAITLATLSGKEVLSEQIGTFELPVTAQEWQKKFSQFVNTESRAWTYLEAASGRFLIKGDELGEYALRLERNVKPVRWVCRSSHHVTSARLVDDSGREDGAICRFLSLRRPAEPVILDIQSVLAGYQVPSPGGLFEARHGELADTMIVSLPQIERGFQGLVIEPDLQDIDGDSFPIVHVLELLRLWSEARILGPLVGIRRRRVVERILNRLYSRLCGRRWAEAEAAYLSNPQSEPELRQLERLVGGSPGFVAILRRDQTKIEAGTGPGAEWFADVAARYQVCSEKGLCEFALQLASHPHNLILVPGPVLNTLLSDIKDKTILLRGARLLALLSASADPGFAGGALPRWKW